MLSQKTSNAFLPQLFNSQPHIQVYLPSLKDRAMRKVYTHEMSPCAGTTLLPMSTKLLWLD